MRKILRNHYKELLKEEIDYSSKVATVYHLTGFKTAQYDRSWLEKQRSTQIKSIDDEEVRKELDKQSILAQPDYKIGLEYLVKSKTSQGQAYHVAKGLTTEQDKLGTGFRSGNGAMYGRGLYTCYNLNPEIASTYGNVILRFDVDISNFLIFNAGIAKKIHGENFRLEDQFFQILKNKNYNVAGFFNREITLDISADSQESLSEFYDFLQPLSDKPEFLNSDIDTKLRTAPIALSALQQFSRGFKNGRALKLRDIIDGIIFYGYTDGPVCIIYEPEKLDHYKLTGAGYFGKDGQPIISSNVGSLVDEKDKDLKSIYDLSQEDKFTRKTEARENRDQEFRDVLKSFDRSVGDEQFLKEIPNILTEIFQPLTTLIDTEICKEIIEKRVQKTSGFDEYCVDIAKCFQYIQGFASVLAEPFFDFIDKFGPGIEIIDKNDFEVYCRLLKKYAENKMSQSGITPKLSDFEEKGLKCQAQNEKEFSTLVSNHLEKIIIKFDEIFSYGGANEYLELLINVGDFEPLEINNKFSQFSVMDLDLDTSEDSAVFEDYLVNNQVFKDVNLKLIDFMKDERFKIKENLAGLEEHINKNKYLNLDGTFNFGGLADEFKYFSNKFAAGGDIFYTLLEYGMPKINPSYQSKSVDVEKFTPTFIIGEMYGLGSDSWTFSDAVGLIRGMYSGGSDLFSSQSMVSVQEIKEKLIKEKTGNLSWVAEDTFTFYDKNELFY
tara:strand:- start:380 stop:2539 length:2160 start_codon:yes stop_codon:yes gene_type:complete